MLRVWLLRVLTWPLHSLSQIYATLVEWVEQTEPFTVAIFFALLLTLLYILNN